MSWRTRKQQFHSIPSQSELNWSCVAFTYRGASAPWGPVPFIPPNQRQRQQQKDKLIYLFFCLAFALASFISLSLFGGSLTQSIISSLFSLLGGAVRQLPPLTHQSRKRRNDFMVRSPSAGTAAFLFFTKEKQLLDCSFGAANAAINQLSLNCPLGRAIQ